MTSPYTPESSDPDTGKTLTGLVEQPDGDDPNAIRAIADDDRLTRDVPAIGRTLDTLAVASLLSTRTRQTNPNPIALGTLNAMRSDSTIAMALRLMRTPILARARDAAIICDDPRVQAFCEHTLLKSGLVYDLMQNCLSALWAGIAAQEKVWQVQTLNLTYATKDPVTGENQDAVAWRGPAITYDKIVLVNPITVQAVLKTPAGQFNGFTQMGPQGEILVEPVRAFIYTHDKEFGNFWGRPAIQEAWSSWLWNQQAVKDWMLWVEHKANPTRVARAPKGTNKRGMAYAELMAQYLDMLGKTTGIVLPPDKEQMTNGVLGEYLWNIMELVTTDRVDIFLKTLQELKKGMTDAIGVPQRVYQEAQYGSKADAQQHTDMFLMMLDAVMFMITFYITHFVMRPLVAVNFGPDVWDATPAELAVLTLTEDMRAATKEIMVALINKGVGAEVFDMREMAERSNVPTVSQDMLDAQQAAQDAAAAVTAASAPSAQQQPPEMHDSAADGAAQDTPTSDEAS